MFRRTIAGALLTAAGIAAALVYKTLADQKEEKKEPEEEEEEIRFIRISDTDEEPEKDIRTRPQQVQEICSVYPYLDPDFVEEELRKDHIHMDEYPEDTLIQITHNAVFPNAETAETFVQIMKDSGYTAESDAPLLVTVSRRFYTVEGAVLSDVLNVANQVNALEGTYHEYFILRS